MSNYSLRNGADSPLPIGDIPVTPEGDYKTPHETPRAFFANGGGPFRSKGRLLPNTPPEEAAMYEKNGRQQQTHGFWQLSPSEERIRRTRRQLSVNEDYEYEQQFKNSVRGIFYTTLFDFTMALFVDEKSNTD
ncbi:hypothetical protein QR680_014128 [Steinernema hermaphroditum]|uniref:Uncharacterized protein n=1 Tax=Steinernema hermaphroditum TaxID=289476 RepID=A0AA39I9D5_9BILA|nr:hypothetical protein QR680_014128 [Steinernema hermaphroditum]